MEKQKDVSKRTLTLKRTFNAPIKLVWKAWTQPAHIVKWWAPKGMLVTVVEHDFRPGGKWKYTMPMPDGSEFISDGVYSVIVELEKIFTSANFRPMTEEVELQIFFEKAGNKTNFTFNVIHATEEYKKQQEQMGFFNGWGKAFDRLEELARSMED
jgi:uncharacterized protein YndB with AHSA1/START domain